MRATGSRSPVCASQKPALAYNMIRAFVRQASQSQCKPLSNLPRLCARCRRRVLAGIPALQPGAAAHDRLRPEPASASAILIDLEDPRDDEGLRLPAEPRSSPSSGTPTRSSTRACSDGVLDELGLTGGEMFAYEITGGSNLDLPDQPSPPTAARSSLEEDVYPKYDLILCISTYSATAPLTAFAKQYGFRGATLHGLNEIILSSGLAVDYNEVSQQAEKLRLGLTKADWFEVDFGSTARPTRCTSISTARRRRRATAFAAAARTSPIFPPAKSTTCPTGAEGQFPMRYEDGTLGLMTVARRPHPATPR